MSGKWGNLEEDCNHTAKSHTAQVTAVLAPHFYRKKNPNVIAIICKGKAQGRKFSCVGQMKEEESSEKKSLVK